MADLDTAISLISAEQQLFGYYSAKQGSSLTDLVSSMALSKSEWEQLQKDAIVLSYLSEEDIEEINLYIEGRA